MSKNKATPALIVLAFEEWETQFKPIANRIIGSASFDGLMFETYGEELAQVLAFANGGKAGHRKVWTLVDGDDGEAVIVEGYHLVNRLGYFITSKPAKAGAQYNISL